MTGYMDYILGALAAVAALATLLPLSKLRHGAIQGLAFPRVQIFWFCGGLAVVALAVQDVPWAAAVFAGCAVAQLVYIAKFTPLWRRQSLQADAELQADTSRQISMIAANVKKSNRDFDALCALVRRHQPDVVLAIEVDSEWIAALESALGQDYPHLVKVPKETCYGLCVLSRLKLSEAQVREVVTEGVPSVRVIVTLPGGARVRLYVVHPEPPVIDHDTKGRDSEIAHIGIEAARDPLPALVAGYLNDVAWSVTTRSFQRLSGLMDPRVGRGFFNTFNAFHWWARWPLDHLFHDPQFRLIKMHRLGKIGSDHFPIFFALGLNPDAPSGDPDADPEEASEVKEMIGEEKARARGPIGSHWED
jgi:endonuclease/exonuclease/phosphatase (EEP) superfamily protein YafD